MPSRTEIRPMQGQGSPEDLGNDGLPSIESTGGIADYHMAADKTTLRYAHWRNPSGAATGTVLYLNGRTEFIEKNLETVEALLLRGFDVWTLDWRGQGLSDRPLANPQKGHVEDFFHYMADLDGLLKDCLLARRRGPLTLLGHSMGGHLALRVLHDYPGLFERAVLSAPMIDIFGGAASIAAAIRWLSWLGELPWFVERYVPFGGDFDNETRLFEKNQLTSDPERFARTARYVLEHPPLAFGDPTLGWLAAAKRSIALTFDQTYAASIQTPVLAVLATEEKIVDNEKARRYCQDLLPRGETCDVPGARHELLIERDELRDRFWHAFDAFLDR